MENFNERLTTLPDLSDDELDALETEMVSAFDAADEAGDVDLMQALADGLDEVRAEQTSRSETEAPVEEAPVEEVAASAATEDAVEPIAATGLGAESPEDQLGTPPEGTAKKSPKASTADSKKADKKEAEPEPQPASTSEESVQGAGEPEDESENEADESKSDGEAEAETEAESEGDDAEAEAEVEVEADAEAETDAEDAVEESSTEQEQEAVDIEVTAAEVPEENSPVAASVARPTVIVAGGDLPGYTAGSELDDMDQVAEAFAAKVNSIRGIAGDGEHILVASLRNRSEADDEHTLSASDTVGNARKIRALVSDPANLTPEALVAAGWCAPKAPIYDIPGIGVTDRPVGSSLPTYNADRGGIIFTRPPVLLVPAAGAPGAVGIFDPSAETPAIVSTMVGGVLTSLTGAFADLKPCLDVDCGTPGEAELKAISLCLCFSNLTARAYPELVRTNTDYALVMQARLAEEFILSRMAAASTSVGAAGTTVLGTARDTIRAIRVAASQFRWVNRLGATQPLSLVLPGWVRDAIAADLNFQAPGDNALETSYSDVDGYFGEFNVDVAWTLDDLSPVFPSAQAYPATFDFILYATGAFLRLDGGSLDLGVVRTKEDIQTNRYCTFSETFEEVAYIGPEGSPGNGTWSYTGTLAMKTKGGVGGAVTIA